MGSRRKVLAERTGLSADTIRRLEHGAFSPSLITLRKLAHGFGLSVTQLFQGFEIDDEGDGDETSKLVALVRGRGPQTISQIRELTRVFLRALDEHRDDLPEPRLHGTPASLRTSIGSALD